MRDDTDKLGDLGSLCIDLKAASDYLYWHDIKDEIQAKLSDSSSTQIMKRQMSRIQALPSILVKLTMTFDGLIMPFDVKFEILWGLIYLNLKVLFHPQAYKNISDII